MQTLDDAVVERAKILTTVKTYPLPSAKHTETVCTAGLRAEGKWIRIYPVPYRTMDEAQRFKKYQWIEADIIRDTRDPRPESYRLAGDISPLEHLDTLTHGKRARSLFLAKYITTLKHSFARHVTRRYRRRLPHSNPSGS